MSNGRQPDYKVKAMNKDTKERSRQIGAAWNNEDGSIGIKLDPFIVLHGGPELIITLFVNDDEVEEEDSKPHNKDRRRWYYND